MVFLRKGAETLVAPNVLIMFGPNVDPGIKYFFAAGCLKPFCFIYSAYQ